LFITGTDTGVGKTYVASLVAAALHRQGYKVGVYKPVASGCERAGKTLVSDDAVSLWEAAGRPGQLADVCPQRFAAPLAPQLAAEAEGKNVDENLLVAGLAPWLASDFVVIEGAGGWMTPLGKRLYVADLAQALGYPVVVVAANRLGVINQTLQTLIAISAKSSLPVAGVVLNDATPATADDLSRGSNWDELRARCPAPLLARVSHRGKFRPQVDWWCLGSKIEFPSDSMAPKKEP
jgi:dethiobiotin synthetase